MIYQLTHVTRVTGANSPRSPLFPYIIGDKLNWLSCVGVDGIFIVVGELG